MATTQVVSELEVALLSQAPRSVQLRTDWLFRNAERKGKAGQIFQAEVVPLRGLEPVNEGCPKGREARKKEMWLKLQGRFIFFRRGHQDSAFLAKVSLAVKTRPLWWARAREASGTLAGRAGAWLGLGARDSAWLGSRSAPGPTAAPGRRGSRLLEPARPATRDAARLTRSLAPASRAGARSGTAAPCLQVCVGARRDSGRWASGCQTAFEVWAGQLEGRWRTLEGQRPGGPAWFPRSADARGLRRAQAGAQCRMRNEYAHVKGGGMLCVGEDKGRGV